MVQNTFKDFAAETPPDESWWSSILLDIEEQKFGDIAKNKAVKQPLTVDWDWAVIQYQQDQIIELTVTGRNRGGLLVENHHILGFVPVSHLVDLPKKLLPSQYKDILEPYLGRSIKLKIIECNIARERVVLSERAALSAPGRRLELLQKLSVGDLVRGRVTTVTKFGVFVDLGGVEGLIHISELSWGRVAHPGEILCPEEEVDVYILNLDSKRCRVALSVKRLLPNPWDTAHERYQLGSVIDAVITNIVPFGAFARLKGELDGLIHISELGGNLKHPGDVVSKGQHVEVAILHIDVNRQQLGLRLHAIKGELA